MTIVDDNNGEAVNDAGNANSVNAVEENSAEAITAEKEGMLSQEKLAEDTKVSAEEVPSDIAISTRDNLKDVVITSSDKVAFIDSVVSNTRFEREYSLFGGKLSITIRSLTAEETNAMAAWAFKQSVIDPTWHLSGRGRKHLLTAQVAKFNGIEIPPLAEPLFETLDKDGKTTHRPGWVDMASFWDDKGAAVVDAVIRCTADFDAKYKILCSKAEDENFWAPDTP